MSSRLWRAALWYGVLVFTVAVLADASTLRHSSQHVLRGGASAKESAAQQSAATQACQNPPCPCLVTPAPYVTAEDLQATQILLAADTAMAKGITMIGQAADLAGYSSLKHIQDVDTNATQMEAKTALVAAEANATAQLDLMLSMELQRQAKMEAAMEVDAKNAASFNAAHMRATSEEWAKNQALHFIAEAADRTMKDAVAATESIPTIRQQATEQAKGAIDASAEALAVAQKAQAIAQSAPKERVANASALVDQMKQEQDVMDLDIERVAHRAADVAETAHEGHDLALSVLSKAMRAAAGAKKALEKTQANAAKIQALQESTQTLYNEAAALAS
mmetsp:Transcript_6035/g.9831  ORF Transcript_6035/g.9831 Transcript_6035/m.9831 type:complete len:335 (+) Transcript_6035:69-1073(+)